MANFGWITLDKVSGNQNKQVEVTATPNTGRLQRTKTLYIRTTHGSPAVNTQITFTQSGKLEFVDFNKDSETAQKEGENITLVGTSNSSKLSFSLENPSTGEILPLELPSTYLADSVSTSINQSINGDPGTEYQYEFSITLNIQRNPNPDDRTRIIRVTANDNGNISDTCTITQTAALPALSVSPVNVALDALGTAQTFTVTSNTNWEISASSN